jgi:hypothetical protein
MNNQSILRHFLPSAASNFSRLNFVTDSIVYSFLNQLKKFFKMKRARFIVSYSIPSKDRLDYEPAQCFINDSFYVAACIL